MATLTEPAEPALATEYPPHRMTIERYEKLAQSGIYGENEPVFLWRGRLVEKMTPGMPHIFVVSTLARQLFGIVPEGWCSYHEQPIVIGDDSMPEPDLTIIRGSLRDFLKRRPTARDVSLVIEVSDWTLAIDSGDVLKAYAAESIPIYWIVNLRKARIEVYSDPSGPAESPSYRTCREYGPGDEVPVVMDGVEVGRLAVGAILP